MVPPPSFRIGVFFDESSVFLDKTQLDGTGGPFTLFGKDNFHQSFRPPALWLIRDDNNPPGTKHDHIREFLNIARVAQIGKHGPFVFSTFHTAV